MEMEMKTDKDLLRLIGAGSDTPPHVACRCFAADLRRVYEAGKEELRQQLAAMTAERDKAKAMPMRYRRMEFNAQLQDENESLRQQLAAALAACKQKDDALGYRIDHPKVIAALAIQPDDSALKQWLGEQSGWTHSCPVLCLDGVELWIDRCPHCGRPAPKGLK